MIKINRFDNIYKEEYINKDCILRCWKEKYVTKKRSYKTFPICGVIDLPSQLEETGKDCGKTYYKHKISGDMYVFAESFLFSDNFWEELLDSPYGTKLYPGWNKIEMIPEEWGCKYFVEIKKSNGEEIVETDEDTYNRIIGKPNNSVVSPYVDKNYKSPFDSPNEFKEGDIVAVSTTFGNDKYYLIGKGLPEYLQTCLCCNSVDDGKLHLYQLGFRWTGSKQFHKFRIATDDEKKKFISACVKQLKTPINDCSFWELKEYSQIAHALFKYGLIDDNLILELKKNT